MQDFESDVKLPIAKLSAPRIQFEVTTDPMIPWP